MNTFVGKRLAEERKRLRLNQDAFAERGGVTRQTQSRYEKGERSPDTDYLERVDQIGVDVLYVITGRRLSSHLTSDEPLRDSLKSEEKSYSYINWERNVKVGTRVPTSSNKLGTDEAQWLESYRQIKPEDRELVELLVRGFAERGKGQQIKDTG